MSGDVTKLPKWAQDRIRLLETNEAHYKAQLHAVEAGESNIWLSVGLRDKKYLPPDSLVVFKLADGSAIEVRHDNHEDGLSVRGWNGAINVRPQSSNVVVVRREDL